MLERGTSETTELLRRRGKADINRTSLRLRSTIRCVVIVERQHLASA
jgi:hypothetical protein